MLFDDACSSTGTGLERTESLGWAKGASGRDWRMLDRLWRDRITACDLQAPTETPFCKNKGEKGSARAWPVAAPMPKSDSFGEKRDE